ncbi:alpha/beta fold hydrolase, partial [Escherichia coli]|uniref:alpha/beta fold hydrolase n=1 Tax=Escherichia coli TaxID=562 RepID=UPI001325D4A5
KNEWDWALQNGRQLILLHVRPCVIPHRYVSVNFLEAGEGRFDDALDELMRVPGLAPTATEVPVTRYALAGEVSVAYQQFGTGPVDLVWVPGNFSHCELTWRLSYMAEHFRRLSVLFRVIVFDKRGTGMSDRTAIAEPLENRMDDIRAVMD